METRIRINSIYYAHKGATERAQSETAGARTRENWFRVIGEKTIAQLIVTRALSASRLVKCR